MAILWTALALPILALLIRRFTTRSAFLTLEDGLTPPGVAPTVWLQAEKKILPFWDPPLRHASVRLTFDGSKTKEVITDRCGRVELTLDAKSSGMTVLKAELLTPGWKAPDANAIVYVVPADRPILVCDIDETISNLTNIRQARTPMEQVPKFPDSCEVLERLGDEFQIVYLTARDHIFMAKTRAWLAFNKFPVGPLLLRRLRYWEAQPEKHKTIRLQETLEGFSGLRVGVGDKMTDVRAYTACNIRPIYFAPGKHADLPKEAHHAKTWKDVESLIRALSPRL